MFGSCSGLCAFVCAVCAVMLLESFSNTWFSYGQHPCFHWPSLHEVFPRGWWMGRPLWRRTSPSSKEVDGEAHGDDSDDMNQDMGPGAKCSAVQHHDCDSSRFNKDVTAGGMSWFMFFCAPIVSLPLLCGWFSWFLHLQKCIRSPQRFLMPFPENGKNYDGNYLAMHWPCTGHAAQSC